MRLCLSIEVQEGMTYPQTLEIARAGEALGFETALLAEHYYPSGAAERYAGGLSQHMAADAWLYLAGLARETSQIRLGTLVSPVTLRHPSVLAKMAATLDHLSDGRAELGMGAGWLESEHVAYGFPFPGAAERVDLLEEQLQVVSGLFASETFTYNGRWYQLRECQFTPRPVQKPRLPLLVGGRADSRRLLRLAARYADEYVITLATPAQCADVRARLDQHAQRFGRAASSVRLSLFVPFCVSASTAGVEPRFHALVETEPLYARMAGARDAWLLGTPAEVGDQLARLQEAGVARVMLPVTGALHADMLPLVSARGS